MCYQGINVISYLKRDHILNGFFFHLSYLSPEKTAFNKLMGTLFPNCLSAWFSLFIILKLSGNPCNLAASLGDSFLTFPLI